MQIKIINETSSDKQEYNLEAGKSDSDFQSNSIIPGKNSTYKNNFYLNINLKIFQTHSPKIKAFNFTN